MDSQLAANQNELELRYALPYEEKSAFALRGDHLSSLNWVPLQFVVRSLSAGLPLSESVALSINVFVKGRLSSRYLLGDR